MYCCFDLICCFLGERRSGGGIDAALRMLPVCKLGVGDDKQVTMSTITVFFPFLDLIFNWLLQYCACVTPQQINIHVNISTTYSMSEKYCRGSYPKSLLYLCNRSDMAAPPRAPARGCWASYWFSLDMPVLQTQPGAAERFLHEKGQKIPPWTLLPPCGD